MQEVFNNWFGGRNVIKQKKKKYKYMKVLYYFKLISTRFDLLII